MASMTHSAFPSVAGAAAAAALFHGPDGMADDVRLETIKYKKTSERNLENEVENPSLEQNTSILSGYRRTDKPHESEPGEADGQLQRCLRLLRRCERCFVDGGKPKWRSIALAGLCLVVLILLGVIIYLAVRKPRMCPPVAEGPACPQGWVLNETSCYFFSAAESTWNDSQRYCSSFGGSLVTLDTPLEIAFVMGHSEKDTYWIGLRREGVGQPWKHPDGSLFSSLFRIHGEGFCAYLNEDRADSTWCANIRRWICRKLLSLF